MGETISWLVGRDWTNKVHGARFLLGLCLELYLQKQFGGIFWCSEFPNQGTLRFCPSGIELRVNEFLPLACHQTAAGIEGLLSTTVNLIFVKIAAALLRQPHTGVDYRARGFLFSSFYVVVSTCGRMLTQAVACILLTSCPAAHA